MKRFYFIAFIIFFISSVFAETEGEKMFKTNNPTEAIPLLENEIASGKASSDAYNYLGLSYYQTGQYDKSIATFEKGLNVSGTDKKILAYNAGNSAFAAGNYSKADSCYSLSLAASPDFTQALLNRANARLNNRDLQNALSDYELYLSKVYNDPQQKEIERVIALIRGEFVRQEEEARIAKEKEQQRKAEEERFAAAQKQIAEENARKAQALKEEQDRIAAEKARQEAEARAAEEARRKKLLEDLANSLQDPNAGNLSSGAEGIIDYDSEPVLD